MPHTPMTTTELREHLATHDRQNSWWLNDARGIPLSRVCDCCIDQVKAKYKPEVLGEGDYEDAVEEPIEPDGDFYNDRYGDW